MIHPARFGSPGRIIGGGRIFDGTDVTEGPGYVAIAGDRIIEVGAGDGRDKASSTTDYRYYPGALLSPAFHDNHTFLTGTLTDEAGIDLSTDRTVSDMLGHLGKDRASARHGEVVVGRGWRGAPTLPSTAAQAELEEVSGAVPTVLLGPDGSAAWLNAAAQNRYGIDRTFPNNEAKALFYRDLAQDDALVETTFRRAAKALASRGVVSVKDIGFDDYLGVLGTLGRLQQSGDFDLRVHFSFQPVTQAPDVEALLAVQATYVAEQLRFHGVKLMTDGILPEGTAHVIGNDSPAIDYRTISDTALALDKAGIPVGLNADGDAAVRECLNIFERCLAENGTGHRRFSLSDASMVHPQDLPRFGELGVSVEAYSQFLLLFEGLADSFIDGILGPDRSRTFNNFRGLLDAGALVTSGTDLPLLWPSIPDAIFAASYRRFADNQPQAGWHPAHGMTRLEVLRTWTSASARACGLETYSGLLKPGMRADLAVLSEDVLRSPPGTLRDTKVLLTVAGGRVVHGSGG